MVTDESKNKILEIKEHFSKEGWECATEVPVIRNNNKLIKQKTGFIDICCEKFRNLLCWEIENQQGNQFQSVLNARDLENMGKEARKKGLNYKKCQLGSKEDFKNVCNGGFR